MFILSTCLVLLALSLYIFNKLTCGICRNHTCLVGKTAIVTGGGSGIGYQVALSLASRGCKVIIADKEEKDTVSKKIIEETNNSNIIYKTLDLSSFKSIRQFVKDIYSSETKLHFLINNAGVGNHEKLVTEDGLNSVFQINHYGPFLLTTLLINLLKNSSPSRIVFTSALLSFMSTLNENNLNPTNWSNKSFVQASEVYGNCNMAIILTANEFAKRLKNYGVTCNSVHPGFVKSGLTNSIFSVCKSNLFYGIWSLTMFLVGKSTWEGAQTTLHVVTEKNLENIGGKHFWDCREFWQPYKAHNQELAKKVWEAAVKLTKLSPEEFI